MNEEDFYRWCTTEKPCAYCRRLFRGPVCPCEVLRQEDARTDAAVARAKKQAGGGGK